MSKLTILCVFVAMLGCITANKDLDLFNAAKDGDLVDVKQALSAGANPNWRNADYKDDQLKRRWSALHVASKYNHPAVISALSDAGADMNLQDSFESTPIFVAAKYESKDALLMLMEIGVDINIKYGGWTVLHEAAHQNQPEIISILLDAGANIDVQDYIGRTPLYLACEQGSVYAANMLIERGANIHITDFTNQSKSDIGQFLSGQTPLMVATYNGHLAMVEALIGAGANIKQTSNNGRTALHWAASRDKRDIALLLMQKGADPRREDNEGNTPAEIARNAWIPRVEMANIIDSFTGLINALTTPTPTIAITAEPTTSAVLYYDLYLLASGIIVFITETLYLALY